MLIKDWRGVSEWRRRTTWRRKRSLWRGESEALWAYIVVLVAANCDALVATFSLRRSLSTRRVRGVSFSFFVIQLPVGKMGRESCTVSTNAHMWELPLKRTEQFEGAHKECLCNCFYYYCEICKCAQIHRFSSDCNLWWAGGCRRELGWHLWLANFLVHTYASSHDACFFLILFWCRVRANI